MSPGTTNAARPDANALAAQRTDLALERTILAADRTLMAWVRTAISMIGFGFTLFKFLQYQVEQQSPRTIPLNGPRNLSLAFIALGIFSLVVAVIQHWQFMKRCHIEYGTSRFGLALAVAGVVGLIGVLALMNVAFRVGPF